MKLTWTIMTLDGPAVGEAQVSDRDHAAEALRGAMRDAFGTYGPEHARAVRRIAADLHGAELPFTYRAKAITIKVEA